MHNHASRLVHDNQVVILEYDVERDRLWRDVTFFGFFDADIDLRADLNACTWIAHHLPGYLHRAAFDQLSQAGARQICILWNITRQRLIKAGRRRVRNAKRDKAVRHD